MKRIYLVLIVFVGVSFGCENYLEEEVFSVLTPNNFFQNEDDVLVALNGVYDGVQQRNLQQVISYTDMIAGSMTWNFGNQYRFLNYEDNFGSIFNNWWVRLYEVVGRANGALEALAISPLPEDVRLNAEGELRFLRAYAYFYLVRMFANVPLVTQAPADLDDVLILDSAASANTDSEFYVQRSREDIYDFIIEDLTFAEANLPESYPPTLSGKATMGAAAGLLAKVYLQRAGKQLNTVSGVIEDGDPSFWGLAATQCEKVMNLNYELEANFEDVFSEANEIDNSEVIFAIKYINSAAIGTDEEGNRIVADNGIVRTGPTPFAFNLNEVPQEFFTFFNSNTEDDDPRRDFTFLTFYVDSNDDTVRWGDTNQFDQVKIRKLLTDLV
ncbi:MAG: RagB/SusD family nutrient uptake outer membrane protein, partial [Bacteroidota bacterium]